jgi:hypothetical protein
MVTGEACAGPHSDKTAPLAFRLSALHERARVVTQAAHEAVTKAMDAVETAMRNLRGPDPDFDEQENTRETMRILRQLIARPSGNSYYEGGNGEKRTLNWILTVLSLLLVGAVGGGVSLYGKVSSLETRVAEWQRSWERESAETRRRLDRLESR